MCGACPRLTDSSALFLSACPGLEVEGRGCSGEKWGQVEETRGRTKGAWRPEEEKETQKEGD